MSHIIHLLLSLPQRLFRGCLITLPRTNFIKTNTLDLNLGESRRDDADWSQFLETVIDHDVRDAPLRGAQHGRLFHHDYDRRVSAARCSRGVSCWSPCKAEVDYGEGAWEEIARRRQGPERGRTVEVRMGRGRGWFHTTLLRESGTASCRCLPRVEGLSHAIALSGHAAARPIPTERRRGSARFAGRGASRK